MWHTVFPTAFGSAAVTWHDAGLVSFDLPARSDVELENLLAARGHSFAAKAIPSWVDAVARRAQAHFRGELQDFSDTALDWTRVGEFQREVFRHTQAIKAGHTCCYGDIARAMSLAPGSARAVGMALGSNPWPLLVPCHRVVSSTGKMTGFSGPGGIATKTRLLALEGAELSLQ